jgi:hypothetical protein
MIEECFFITRDLNRGRGKENGTIPFYRRFFDGIIKIIKIQKLYKPACKKFRVQPLASQTNFQISWKTACFSGYEQFTGERRIDATEVPAHNRAVMGRQSPNTKDQVPSLAWFARQPDPFQDLTRIAERLKLETAESRFLEWKTTPPIGSSVTLRTKYRVVKAAISFANTEGGFVLFGVEPKGKWLGFTEADLKESDPAALAELINGSVSPELLGLNCNP